MKLTAKQQSIIESASLDSILVEAGPGTGKTEVVARRLAWLMSSGGLKPSQILVLSFSKAAVKALVKRIMSLEGIQQSTVEELRHLAVRTFDSWAFRMLRFWGDSPADLLRKCHDDNISQLTERLRDATDTEALPPETHLRRIRHIVVDEFQDLTGVRALLVQELLRKLAPAMKNAGERCGFTLLGDSNQAIYEWTQREQGGEGITSRELISWVKAEYGGGLRMERLIGNHRSDSDIASIVSEASQKIMEAEEAGHDPYGAVCTMLEDERRQKLSDIVLQIMDGEAETGLAVLCRSNNQVIDVGIRFAKELKRGELENLNFILDICTGDSKRHLPSWIAGMLHRFKVNQLPKAHFKRMYDEIAKAGNLPLPCSGNWEETWKLLLRCAQKPETDAVIQMEELRERLKWPDSLPDDEDSGSPRVVVTTIHKSKGLEYDLVTLVEPNGQHGDDSDSSEEARVLFVGMSRAKREMSLLDGEPDIDFHHRHFEDGRRSRWNHWHDVKYKGASRYLEIGIEGDVRRESFVMPNVLGGEESVKQVQSLLLSKCNELAGEDIVLKKVQTGPRNYVYNIVLPNYDDMIIGRMSDSLKYDLLDLKHKKQSLPVTVYGLKINRVVTLVSPSPVPEGIPEPWRVSGLWAGVDIHGMGSFMTFWIKG